MPTTTALPHCHIVKSSHLFNEHVYGEYTPDSGDLALHTIDFADPMWLGLLRHRAHTIFNISTRTLALRMRALVMVANDNQNLHSLVRLRAQLVNA